MSMRCTACGGIRSESMRLKSAPLNKSSQSFRPIRRLACSAWFQPVVYMRYLFACQFIRILNVCFDLLDLFRYLSLLGSSERSIINKLFVLFIKHLIALIKLIPQVGRLFVVLSCFERCPCADRASLPQQQAARRPVRPQCSDHAPGPQRSAVPCCARGTDHPQRRPARLAARLGTQRGRAA